MDTVLANFAETVKYYLIFAGILLIIAAYIGYLFYDIKSMVLIFERIFPSEKKKKSEQSLSKETICPKCGADVSSEQAVCSNCGYEWVDSYLD